ncbi:hypothetical protein LGR54_22225 [Ancylobacter sp. Lp-2]|uniref:hypothetical protein n=1 Tax=Ancylobacter sp. Lp-2 TaxID=2881339 RepID=UPI001E2D62A2|nr:hypothetical protein [Ancylobacter sp. Lp-2]MCB4771331.1 hypothetical protein [Ancylobacter sp. Lp-2]
MIAGNTIIRAFSGPSRFCAVLVFATMAGGMPAHAQNWEKCVEAIAKTQQELQNVLPKSPQPKTQQQSVAAQDSHDPTPDSLAAAGLEAPVSGPAGALNEAQNLQAAGDEAGCMKAVAKARSLAGLK